jgi:hypothetical protein
VKIAFIGAQCSGKTTTLWHVGATLKKLGLTNFTLIQEVARSCPYPLKDGRFDTANWILLQQILAEHQAERKWEHVITDRSVFDEIPFFEHGVERKNLSVKQLWRAGEVLTYIQEICRAWQKISPYTKFFLFTPLPLVSDADRTCSEEERKEINSHFMRLFLNDPNVIEVKGKSKSARTKFVTKKIIELLGA